LWTGSTTPSRPPARNKTSSKRGQLLDELITRRIGLGELNDAFDALRSGEGARSVLVLD